MAAMYGCIDVGSSSVKLGVYDDQLKRHFYESTSVPTSVDGMQDAEKILGAVRHLILRARDAGARSVGIATYRASMLAWDREGRPLSGVVTWLSAASAESYRRLPAYVRMVGRLPPLNLIVSPTSPAMRYLWLKQLLAEKAVSDALIWTLESYLAYALTGRYVADAANSAMTGFIHPATLKPIRAVNALLSVEPALPEIVDNTEQIGHYGGVDLCALSADQQAACVGEAALEEGVVKVTNGSGTFVDVPLHGYMRKRGLIPIVILRHRGVVHHGLEGYLPTSGLAVDLLRTLGVVRDYSDLEVDYEPLASSGAVVFVPSLAGLQFPSKPSLGGVISNLRLHSERRHLVLGLLKSVAFQVKAIVDRSGVRPRAVRADGKLSASRSLLRLISACLGVPVETQDDLEATLRGLCVLQLLGEGKLGLADLNRMGRRVEVISEPLHHGLLEEYRKWMSTVASLKT